MFEKTMLLFILCLILFILFCIRIFNLHVISTDLHARLLRLPGALCRHRAAESTDEGAVETETAAQRRGRVRSPCCGGNGFAGGGEIESEAGQRREASFETEITGLLVVAVNGLKCCQRGSVFSVRSLFVCLMLKLYPVEGLMKALNNVMGNLSNAAGTIHSWILGAIFCFATFEKGDAHRTEAISSSAWTKIPVGATSIYKVWLWWPQLFYPNIKVVVKRWF